MQINKKQIAYNYNTRTCDIMYIVIHDTGNTDSGADAVRHYNYFNGGNRGSSADFFVDDKQVLQVNDYERYYTWHCGDGHGKYGISNNNSVGIEICINSDGDYNKAVQNAVELTQYLMGILNIDINHVVRHYDASRKNCPQSMSGNGWSKWAEFKKKLQNTEELTMSQYNELKDLIKAQAAKISDLQNINRQLVNVVQSTMIYDYVDDNMPDWARKAVQAAMDCGAIQGDENGRLGLNYKDLRTIVREYRCGMYNR